ncbi:intraflagellar transport protein 74 homolog [Acanthaster planci]|uniref:Intraflagellar transport protein 74 homolog n=1 Tax=Acanthaster planci TaxID=133434 RepID=A0A8B7Y3J2_ACAPL|nr:intraflagellar transport protein 74 homolog [Acanthaster planci]
MNRPPSGGGRRPTTGARPNSSLRQAAPGTAMRMPQGTGAPGTARPGTRGGVVGGVGVLDAKLSVTDRPTTQQGLGGMRTGKKGPQRVVMDKSYFLGMLRTKLTELQTENSSLQRNIDQANEENNSYLSYEKRAESLANTVKELQGQLADYNTLVDKLNTDTAMEENPPMRQKYMTLKQTNESLARELEARQQELDSLNTKKENLEDELSHSQVKQEAVRLYEQLHELEEKKAQLIAEDKTRGTPTEERERLLKQVKEDNQEIASMDRQIQEYRDQINTLQEEIRQLDMDLEEHQGEKNMKYKELKKRDETMTEFLESFEDTKSQEMEHKANLEENIVAILSHLSRNLGRTKHMPSPQELARMQDDLSFKQTEMQKSEATATSLAGESARLQMDLQKVEQLEAKINAELETLKAKIDTMNEELEKYSDLNRLRAESDQRKQKLQEEKVTLTTRRDTFKQAVQELSAHYEATKTQLNENETYAQLGNLERKWQHHEQNNFVMKEFIAAKSMESDYRPLVATVKTQISDYNKLIQESLTRGVQR